MWLSKGCDLSYSFLQNALTSYLYGRVLLYTFQIVREAYIQSSLFSFALGP